MSHPAQSRALPLPRTGEPRGKRWPAAHSKALPLPLAGKGRGEGWPTTPLRLVVLSIALLSIGCGGGPNASRDVRQRLESAESQAARERVPDLIASVEAAIEAADNAEAAGNTDAASDHATRARLLLDAAQAEAVRIGDEEERARVEERISQVLARARRDEDARAQIDTELARLASARTAREEALRALQQAQQDEARPGRRARLSLEQAEDLRRAATILRARARLAAAAAESLGADAHALRPVNDALTASEQAVRDPVAALDAADRANHEALRALGTARRALSAPGPDGPAELAEAARADGFEALALPEGLAVEADRVYSGNALARQAADRVRQLAALVIAHPHGPVQVQSQAREAGARGEQLARQRAEALRRALVEAGVDAARLSAGAVPSALAADVPAERARLVFVAYAAGR